MKRALREADPLEETLENPDLPPLTRETASVATAGRRARRLSLVLAGVAVVVIAIVGVRFGFGG